MINERLIPLFSMFHMNWVGNTKPMDDCIFDISTDHVIVIYFRYINDCVKSKTLLLSNVWINMTHIYIYVQISL